jgi:hypothetical protein
VTDGEALTTKFLNENLDSTLVVTSAERTRRPAPGSESEGGRRLVREPTRKLRIRVELDPRTFLVQAKHLEPWCLKHRVSEGTLLDDLADDGKCPSTDKRRAALGRGIGHLSGG